MTKRKITCLFSVIITLILLCVSVCLPFFSRQRANVLAKAEGSEVYAFVSKQNDKVNSGKYYMDIGLSLDVDGDGAIARADAETMMKSGIAPFESAKIYVRTRNISAVAEMGDYEALDETFTVFGNSPFTSFAVTVNNVGLQVGDNTRQFYVEIYKVEVTGLKGNYTFIEPNKARSISSKTLNTGSEFSIGTQTDALNDGTVKQLGLSYYQYYLSKSACADVATSTSFNDVRINLGNVANGWYNNIKYLSDHDMAKLGIRVAVTAYETSDWYTDNSYVGIQIFGGDSSNVGAPALEGVPAENVYNNGSAVELARWFTKFQSDMEESMELREAFNGKFEGVTVSSYFDKNVYLAHEIAKKEYGQGGIFDADVGSADIYRENTFLIDDLDAVLNGSTTISVRAWKYLSEKDKFYDGYMTFVPTNYRAQVENITFGQMYYDENGKAKVGASLRFSEPVQFKQYYKGKDIKPYITGYINGNAGLDITFNYVAGQGTDTLFFEADVSDHPRNITRITLTTAHDFEDVYDFAPNAATGGSSGGSQNLTVMRDGVVNGWDNISTKVWVCSYDLREPQVDLNGRVSETVKTSHTVTINTDNISETGTFYYGWTTGEQVVPQMISALPVSSQGFQAISSPSGISGTRYLYVKTVSELGKESEAKWFGPYHFDNYAPEISVDCTNNEHKTKSFTLKITNNLIDGFEKYSSLNNVVKVSVSSSEEKKEPKEFSIKIEDSELRRETVTISDYVLTAENLGLEKGKYGTYYITFSVSDELGNRGISETFAYYFDTRDIFDVSLVKEPGDCAFEMDEFAPSGVLNDTLGDNYYTIDLSKKVEGTDFCFRFKTLDSTVISMVVKEFQKVVSTERDVAPNISQESDNGKIKVTLNNKFSSGLYCLILKDASSNKETLPIYFYVTNGKVDGSYQEDTEGYQFVSDNIPFTNRVFQIPTSVPYYYLTADQMVKTQSYSEGNQPATFSSRSTAFSYVLYREHFDLFAITLSETLANDLNRGGMYRKAENSPMAVKDQVWIRYKEINWSPSPNSTTNTWVYYYYAEEPVETINLGSLSHELQQALNTVAGTICTYGEEVDLVADGQLDGYGAPMLSPNQTHLAWEQVDKSINGTVFTKPYEYYGDIGVHLALNAKYPLSTNTIVPFGEYTRLYYKTSTSGYQPLIQKGNAKTFGEYLNATGEFTILELDKNGAREYGVFIDKTAPEVNVSWNDMEEPRKFTKEDNGKTISGNNFRFESLADDDTMSFISIYRYTALGIGSLLHVYRQSDFDMGREIHLDDGKYYVRVSDRSGNSYTFVLQMNSNPLVCTVKEVDNSYIRVEVNRGAEELRYEVFLNGILLTTDFNDIKFTESGEYRFLIEDIYGNVYEETYTFERDLPIVTWHYQTSEGSYKAYEQENEQVSIQRNDELNYTISTSTHLRFFLESGWAYEIISGNPSPSYNSMSRWVTMNNKSPFTMKVYYESHPDTYVTYTCTVDNTAPQITVSYEEGYFTPFELDEIQEAFKNGDFDEGDNPFIPSLIGFTSLRDKTRTLYVADGQCVQSKYFKVQASDDSGVKEVKVYLDGELILTKESDFNNIYISRRGAYEIVATDRFGNVTSFTFTNEFDERVKYFVDGEKMSTDLSFVDYFKETEYTKVEYGNAKAEIKLLSSVEVHYIITDAEGNAYYFAFAAEDGMLYTFQYVVKIVEDEGGKEIEGLTSRGVNALSSGVVAKIDQLGVAIYLSKNNDGSLLLSVQSVDNQPKTYTVEVRVSTAENEAPYYFKTKISNIPSSIEFVDGKDHLLRDASLLKVNDAFKVRDTLGADIQSVQVAYSETGKYTTYETVYDGEYSDRLFEKEGMYHVKVVNIYGIQTDYYVIISSEFVMTATVEYADGTTLTYSKDYTMTHDDFYSNQGVEFIVYSTNVTVPDKVEGVSVTPTDQGYTLIYVNKLGSYTITVEDEYGNRFEKNIFISMEQLSIGENVLTGFSEKTIENYTNQKVVINKDAVLSSNIAFVSMLYNGQAVTIYDQLSEEKTSFDSEQCVGLLGDGDYTLIFRDVYGNKVETVVHYCGTPTLIITRNTLNGVGEEVYSIDEMLANGVWTNDSVSFTSSASKATLKVNGEERLNATVSFDSKTQNEYEVYYLDEYGFEYTFIVYLHRAEVVVEPTTAMSITTISDLFVTKDSVQVQFTENALCTYTLNNEPEKAYAAGDVLYKDGIYRFKVVDKAGNLATYTVKKDSAVEYRLEGTGAGEILINGGVTNGTSVKFYPENSDNAYIKKVFHNNELIEYKDEIFTERGKWELILADDAGNETYFRFYILYGKLDGFTYSTPYNYEITSVKMEVEDSVADAKETIKKSGQLLEATENGKYTVTMVSSVTGDVKTFTFTIDKTPPEVELVGCSENEKTINNVTLKGCTVGDTIYVYKDGVLKKTVRITSDYMDSPTIDEAGKYKIIVENEAGVTTEFTFERKYVPNVAGSVLIIILSLVCVGGLMVGLIWRNHSKTDD